MQIICKISNFKKIIEFKVFFLKCIKRNYRQFLINFLNSKLKDKEIIIFLKQFKKVCLIKVVNIPFCINNFNFLIDDNQYNYSLSNKCIKCSYALSCKGNKNKINEINFLKDNKVTAFKNNIINGISEIYYFLIRIGFKEEDIYISSNKYVLYYFLFKGYNMFFNSMTEKYFYISGSHRIYVVIKNNRVSSKLFSNKGKNLIFKNKNNLKDYIQLMDKINLDITFYSNELNDNELTKEEENISVNHIKKRINNMLITFKVNSNIDFLTFFNYKNKITKIKAFSKNIVNGIFKGSKKINGIMNQKRKLEVINITKQDYISLPENFVLVGNDTIPKFLKEIIKADCILLQRKTEVSHGAIMSRELKKDCIYGIEAIAYNVDSGDILEIDFKTLIIKKLGR